MMEELKRMRRECGISQKTAAKRIGVGMSTYSAYERGYGALPKEKEDALRKYLSSMEPKGRKCPQEHSDRLQALDGAAIWPETIEVGRRRYRVGRKYKLPVRAINVVQSDVISLHKESVTLIGAYRHVAVFQRYNGLKESYTWQELLRMNVREA